MMEEQPVPTRRQCGTLAAHYLLVEQDPSFRDRLSALEEATARRMALGTADVPAKMVTIQVVVHVLYNKDPENISDAQIKSEIDVLNQDFRSKNPNIKNVPKPWKGLVADAKVQFALASKDPAGSPTTGITRTRTDRTSFSVNDEIKFTARGGKDTWGTNYLNCWVGTLRGGLLGYAQFPGGPPETDGVVILNTGFGTTGTAAPPFNGGQTTTHEVGHWLNCRHIWGDDPGCAIDDRCTDTPSQATQNFGCPTFPHVSCNNGPNGDMFMNFMDYVDDSCMSMFTPQQVARMLATLEGPRSTLGQS
jgi:hypothetical protein